MTAITSTTDGALSVGLSRLTDMPRHHPWRALRALPEWSVHLTDELPYGAHGWTRWEDRTIWLLSSLDQTGRRCALEHERQHIVRGEVCGDADEAAVEQATARTLIPLSDLVDALHWSRHPREVADHCWVTLDVLTCRVRNLHPAEVAAVAEVLRHHHAA